MAELDRARAELEAAGIHAEVQVREWRPVAGRDVAALGGFRLHVMAQEQEIAVSRAKSQSALDAQEAAMLEARRRCRLLERLKERRLAEWQRRRRPRGGRTGRRNPTWPAGCAASGERSVT